MVTITAEHGQGILKTWIFNLGLSLDSVFNTWQCSTDVIQSASPTENKTNQQN